MPHSRVLVLAVTACLALVAAAPASAAQRYASPTSSDTTGTCGSAAPCTLRWAIMGAAANETVTVQPGDYTISSQIKPAVPVKIRGDESLPMPNILEVAPMLKDGLDLGAGSSISHMRIESMVADRDAVDLHGATGEDLILVISSDASGTAGHPPAAAHLVASATSKTVLRSSVAYARGAGDAAVIATTSKSPAAGDRVLVSNVTAVASGPGSVGLLSAVTTGLVTVRNTIMLGTAADAAADVPLLTSVSSSNFRPATPSNLVDLGANQSADPLFVSAAGGDFHVQSGSLVIDAGIDDPEALDDEVDPDGRPRDLGAAPDIGAFEFSAALTGALTPPGEPVTAAPAPDATTRPPAPLAGTVAPALQPQVGTSVVVQPVSGVVRIRAASGATRTLKAVGGKIPVNSIVDVTRGVVKLTSVRDRSGNLQSARFWGGKFVVRQNGKGDLTTTLGLRGGSRAGCANSAVSARTSGAHAARRPRPIRSLWGSDSHGRYRTRGSNSVATVRGTRWLTQDRCDGTLTRVTQGVVVVRNLRTKRTVLVRAGHSYLARRAR